MVRESVPIPWPPHPRRSEWSASVSQAGRIVVLVSGSGTNLQALLDAAADPAYGARVVAVGADRDGIAGLARATDRGIPTFVTRVRDFADREAWDAALTDACAAHDPDLVVSAGFLKLVGPRFLGVYGGRYINTHNALLPAFPGMHGPRDASPTASRSPGRRCTSSTPASTPERSSRR